MTLTIAVVGASGRLGGKVIRRLLTQDSTVVAIARNPERIPDYGDGAVIRIADCLDHGALTQALADADIVVSCVHACFAPQILAAMPQGVAYVVLTGSTRKFTNYPDDYARQVISAQGLLETRNKPGVILHPTMIYGAQGENNVQRMGALIKRFRMMLLPHGGRALMQPVHVDDVAASFVAAVHKRPDTHAIVISGPEPVSFANFIKAIAKAMKTSVLVLSAPMWLMYLLARILKYVPGAPRITDDEIQRLVEDKAHDNADMVSLLDVEPRALEQGLSETFTATK